MFRKLYNEELGRIGVEEYKNSEKAPVCVVMDNVRSGHNVGSAFRTCDAFRISKIWLCGICATPPSPEIHKTALGAEFSVGWEHSASTLEVARQLKSEGWTLVGVEQAENSTMLQDFAVEAGRRYAFIFGNEVSGVSQEVMDLCDIALEIPQEGTKHSLNVSVSVGIVLWDAINKIKSV